MEDRTYVWKLEEQKQVVRECCVVSAAEDSEKTEARGDIQGKG